MKMGLWTVDWETWNFNENGEIQTITWLTPFKIKANSLDEATELAESRAAKELSKAREKVPENFAAASNSVPRILGLKDEKGHYYELRKHKTVFGGQVTEMPDYGSFE